MDKYYTAFIPKWYCNMCGRAYFSFENKCLWCNVKEKEAVQPARHQYIDLPSTSQSKKQYFERDIIL